MILSNRAAAPLRALAVVVAAAVAPAIAGCEAGFNAPTQQWHQPAAGASKVVNNEIRINNLFVLGAAPAFSLQRGGSAGLFLALNNEGAPDRLIAITAPGTAAAVQMPGGGVRLASSSRCSLPARPRRVILRGLTRQLERRPAHPGRAALPAGGHVVIAGPGDAARPVVRRPTRRRRSLVRPSPTVPGRVAGTASPGATSPSPSPSATG